MSVKKPGFGPIVCPLLYLAGRDHGSVGHRVPVEWGLLSDDQRGMGSLVAFKRGSRDGFLAGYKGSVCLRCVAVMCVGQGREGERNTTWVPLEERGVRSRGYPVLQLF